MQRGSRGWTSVTASVAKRERRESKVKKRIIVVSVALAGCLALAAGCGSGSNAQQKETSGGMQAPAQATSAETSAATSGAPASATVVFGTQSEEGASFEMVNKTGKDITVIEVKSTGDEAYQTSLIPEGEVLKNGESAQVFLPKIEAAVSEASDIMTKPMADARIVTSDGNQFELHQIDVYDVTDAAVRLSDAVAYLEYKSLASNEALSTLAAELAWLEMMAQAEAEQQQPAQEEVYYEETYYEEPTYYEESTYYYEAPAGGGGGEDQCVPDIILR